MRYDAELPIQFNMEDQRKSGENHNRRLNDKKTEGMNSS